MPFGMSGHVQSVVVDRTAYVGGGDTTDKAGDKYIVMTYDISTGKWGTLPPYTLAKFAITSINNELVLVGGREHGHGKRSNRLGAWDANNKRWACSLYPPMHTARSSSSALAYKKWLIVAGGEEARDTRVSSVEVMNIDTKQWHSGLPTPTPWSHMWTAVVGDMCYFMGGVTSSSGGYTDKVYTVCLSALTSGLTLKEPPKWKKISGLHLIDSTPVSINGFLLAVGGEEGNGEDENGRTTSAIHLYQPDTGKWVKVGDLPTPRQDCICTIITDTELLVVGGGNGENKPLKNTVITVLKYI